MTQEQIAEIVENAVDRSLGKLLFALDVNPEDPQALEKLRARMEHVGRQYEACKLAEPYVRHGIKSATGVIAAAIAGYVVLAFSGKLP